MITIEDQIACVKREIAMRKRVYKKRVDSHAMDPDQAEREIATMEAVLGSLNSVAPFNELDPAQQRKVLNVGSKIALMLKGSL